MSQLPAVDQGSRMAGAQLGHHYRQTAKSALATPGLDGTACTAGHLDPMPAETLATVPIAFDPRQHWAFVPNPSVCVHIWTCAHVYLARA
ncbi:hypothetical protein RhoFasB10_00910 [Rhodococcus sp. B10]|nr:hypothetical protein [Rhodococcus sp. B10]